MSDRQSRLNRTAPERIDPLLRLHLVDDADGTDAFLRQDGDEFAAALLETVADA